MTFLLFFYELVQVFQFFLLLILYSTKEVQSVRVGGGGGGGILWNKVSVIIDFILQT